MAVCKLLCHESQQRLPYKFLLDKCSLVNIWLRIFFWPPKFQMWHPLSFSIISNVCITFLLRNSSTTFTIQVYTRELLTCKCFSNLWVCECFFFFFLKASWFSSLTFVRTLKVAKSCYTYFTVSGVLPSTISFSVQCMEGMLVEKQYFRFKR